MKKITLRLGLAFVGLLVVLQLTGCVAPAPSNWIQVCKGMDRGMVHALLGEPKFASLDGLEEIYPQPMVVQQNTQTYADSGNTYADSQQQMFYRELHVQFNAGGTVVRAFQLVIRN